MSLSYALFSSNRHSRRGHGGRLALAAICIVAASVTSNDARAAPITYDFDSVGVPGASDTVDVCQPSCPLDVVAGLPGGDDGVRASSGSTTAARVNVRNAANPINGSEAVADDATFNGHFGAPDAPLPNNFLVLGDNDGPVFGTGTVSPGTGQSFVRLPFLVPGGTATVRFAFDMAFNGIDTSGTAQDVVNVKLTNAAGTASPLQLASLGSDSGFQSRRFLAGDLPVWSPTAEQTGVTWWLEFELLEGGEGTQSAVGLDNVSIATAPVPLPAPVLMLGSAMIGMALLRRRAE
ncbi:MAG: VPLPA-CTERM sorting domain-containing protein [Gammaproteobacteria bacterium]|nr:VPLPA-CTERM sorting domain-containing protein [Gammaproteobacteria bacterium]MCG3144310.1 hypothetical protein [Gammaproteobacteria bacterium]